MKLPRLSKKLAWLPVFGLLVLGGAAYRIIAAGGGATSSQTSNNLRQPIANTNGLVAWYPLDGNTQDYTGNSLNGSLVNSPQPVSGKFGKAYSFSGTNSYLYAPVPTSVYASAFTWSLWVNPTASQYTALLDQGGSYHENLIPYGTGIRFELQSSSGLLNVFSSGTSLGIGYWNLVVATYDPTLGSNQMKVYINGTLAGQGTLASANGFGSRLYVGTYNSAYLSGSIDDLRIYSRALPASEIASLYAGSPPQNCDQTCRVWLRLDDNKGTTASDSSGNGNAGTISGTTAWTTGNFASALTLDGSTGSVSLPNLGLTAGTVDMWIDPASVSGDQRLFSQASGASAQAGSLAINQSSGENGSLWVWDGSAWQRLANDGTIAAGKWNEVVVTNSGSTATAYVNGTQQLTATAGFSFSGVAATVGGKFLGTTGGTFNGIVDDFRVYSRILAPEEVADQWRQGT